MVEGPDLSGFAAEVRTGIQENVSLYDQALASWKSEVIDLVHSSDYVFHELGTDYVVPAAALMAAKMAVSAPFDPERPVENMGVMIGLVIQWLLDLEHENKRLILQLSVNNLLDKTE